MNDEVKAYNEYYANQGGTGLIGYSGTRYQSGPQRGGGFFSSIGSIFSGLIRPIAKYLGTQALSTGIKIGDDYLNGEKIGDSARKRLKATGKQILGDAIEKGKTFIQKGGHKRKKTNKAKKKQGKKKKMRKNTAKNVKRIDIKPKKKSKKSKKPKKLKKNKKQKSQTIKKKRSKKNNKSFKSKHLTSKHLENLFE